MPDSLLMQAPVLTGGAAPLRVVSIAHTAVSRAAGRRRYEPLADLPGLELTLVVPERWHEYGRDIAADPPDPGLDIRVERIRLPKAGPAGWYLHHYPRLGRILAGASPDVIHLWEEPWSLVAAQAALWRARRRPQAALVLETDQNILRRLPPPFQQLRRALLARTDLLIARNQEALQVSRSCGYQGPAEIVEYGMDAGVFHPRDRAAARSGLAPPEGLLLGYVGRLVPEKGLLEVIEGIARSGTGATLLLLGEGPQAAELQARAAKLGVTLRLLPPRDPQGVGEFMAGLDALVLMSRTTRTWKEQFGRVIMEAQGCGVPVIGSDSGAIPGVIGRGGWVLPEGDAEAVAALLRRLAADPAELRGAGRRGHADATARFTYDAVATGLLRAWRGAARARVAA